MHADGVGINPQQSAGKANTLSSVFNLPLFLKNLHIFL